MKNKLFLLLLICFLMIVYGRWFLPGPRVANDYSYVSDSILKSSMHIPFVWSEMGAEGIGEYSSFFLWGWPLTFIIGILANLGLSFVFLEKFVILLSILIVGGVGVWKYAEHINLSNTSRFVLTIFYLANTYILLLIDGGQLSIALAYSWFLINFLTIQKSIGGGIKKKILASLCTAILGFFDLRFIYILSLLCFIRCVYELLLLKQKKLQYLLEWMRTGFFILVVVLGIHAFWIFPFLKAPISSNTYNFFTQTSFTSYINLGHSILVLAPNWFINVFGSITPLRFEFIFIPVLIFLAPILKPKSYEVGFWLFVAIISIFLAKGPSAPLSQIYIWLFNYLPGFSLFRDSTKFFFLVVTSYSILLGVSIEEIIKKFRDLKRVKIIFLILLATYFLILVRPIWMGQMTGTFSSTSFQNEYFKLGNLLESDENFSRVFWIPSIPPLGYSSLNHPRVEAARLVQRRTFAIGTKGTYEFLNFLREAPYMGEIFDVSGIGYITYPYLDVRRDNMHPDNIKYYYTFSDQLSELPWLSKVENSPILLWKTKQHQDKFFVTPNAWWVIGSDSIYSETTKSSQLKLSKNALIFAEEQGGLGKRINELPQARIVLNNKTLTDLAAGFINPEQIIFPASKLTNDPNESGWWKKDTSQLIWWRDFLQTKYGIDNQDFDLGGGWAVGEGNLEFRIQNSEFRKDNILLARVMESSRSGVLKFYQGGHKIGEVKTQTDGDTNVRWFEVGQLSKDSEELEVRSSGDINVVNALAILDRQEWIGFQKKANNLSDRIVDFNEENTQQKDTIVTYQQINPTKYKVSIKNLTDPSFLVFSQTYDGLWKMNGQGSLPVYSLLNGFRVEKDGEYLVEFEVQKYVYPGLIISGVTLISIILLLLKTRKPRKFRI